MGALPCADGHRRSFLEEVARRVDSGADALRTKSPDELQPAVEAGYSEELRLAPSEALASRARRRRRQGWVAELHGIPAGTARERRHFLWARRRARPAVSLGVLLGQKALGSGDVVEVSEVARSVLSGWFLERLAALADDDLCRCRDHVQQVLVEVGQIGFVARRSGRQECRESSRHCSRAMLSTRRAGCLSWSRSSTIQPSGDHGPCRGPVSA